MNILRTLHLTLFLLVFTTFGASQNEKAQYQLDFNSEFEALAFELFEHHKSKSALPLFLASSVNGNTETRTNTKHSIDQLIAKIEKKGIGGKSYKSALKIIYRVAEREVLKQYQTHVQFQDLFENGKYNCVTATALYAMIFDHFQIPYTIKLQPHHVFLIVDPHEKPIIFETTDPIHGMDVISYKDRYNYVEALLAKKEVSVQRKTAKAIKKIYKDQFLFTDQNIELADLAAAQYYNNALEAIQLEDYESALKNTEKSAFLNPTNRNNYLQFVCLYQLVAKLDYKNPSSFSALFKLYHLSPTKELEAEIHHHFFALSEELLFLHPDAVLFDRYYNLFAKALEGHDMESDIKSMFYMQKAKAASIAFDYTAAQNYINKAYELNPENLRIKRILTEIVLEQCQLESTTNNIDDYIKKYPFLKNHPQLCKTQKGKQAGISPRTLFPFYSVYFWPTATQQKRGLLPQLKGKLKLDPNYDLFRNALKHIFNRSEEHLLTQH